MCPSERGLMLEGIYLSGRELVIGRNVPSGRGLVVGSYVRFW
jgi:hypothetical protein